MIQRLSVKTQDLQWQVSMDEVCMQFGISRQAHYQKLHREAARDIENEFILEMVRQVRRKHPRMGCRKILYKIQPKPGVSEIVCK